MKLVVISPESADPREFAVLAQFFAEDLTSYHLRKPSWSRDQLAAHLRALPVECRPHLVLHSHHDLAVEFNLGGVHNAATAAPGLIRSRAVHDLAALRESLHTCDRLLLSPMFPSFSKPGYGPSAQLSEAGVRSVLSLPRRAEVFALGGIDVTRIPACLDLGFDGIAVLGAIWQATDPVHAFRQLQNALHAHAS